MNRLVRTLVGSILTIVGLTALTGCDHFAADPIAIAQVDEAVIVRMCLPVTVTSIELKTYSDDDDSEGRVVWAADGSAELGEGHEFSLGTAPEGMTMRSGSEEFEDVRATLGSEFGVSIDATDSHGDHTFFAFIEDKDLANSRWVDGGGPVKSPCVRQPCPPGYACFNQWPQPSGPALSPDPTWTPRP